MVVYSLLAAIAVAEMVSATNANDTIDEDRCIDIGDRVRFIDRDTRIDYFMEQPFAAVAIIAFVNNIERELAKNVFACKNISFGLDPRAEEYYAAILQVRDERVFRGNGHPPSWLTVEQAKEIFYIETDERALFWLAKERNNKTGRLYYYFLLGTYQNWLHPEDAGSAIAVMKNAGMNGMEIEPVVYQLATAAYFHSRAKVDQCILGNDDLPTDELKEVEIILERANNP